MSDIIEIIGNSKIQHGNGNQRIYVMKYNPNDQDLVFKKIDDLLKKNEYSKIFAKVKYADINAFLNDGFSIEAAIRDIYGNSICLFLGKFISDARKEVSTEEQDLIKSILSNAQKKYKKTPANKLSDNYSIRIILKNQAEDLANLYRIVFKSYPFPIFDSNYLLNSMDKNVVYFGCFYNNNLIAAASSEIDFDTKSVEMTDFATNKEYLGKNISFHLLKKMESEMKKRGILRFNTIARSLSYGINITFSKSGYHYGGTLINNTNISGKIESMNVWYKTPQS